MIFLDNASTTKCLESSAEIIKNELINDFFNPSAKYNQALTQTRKLETAREEILKVLGGLGSYSVAFTGSATEANNLVLSSSINKHKANLIGTGEHSSVIEKSKFYLNKGIKVVYVPLNDVGEIDKDKFKELMTSEVGFVSIMLVSNETGAINDVQWITKFAKSVNPKVLVHVDAVQGFCKIKINLKSLDVDYLTISSHKIEGPKGVGALVYKKQAKLEPEILGGGQENGKRSGTENVPSILGFVNSIKELSNDIDKNFESVKAFKLKLVEDLAKFSANVGLDFVVNGDPENSSPYILSIGFVGTKGEVLLHSLEREGILVGTGSACNSKHSGNRTLEAMGKTKAEVESNIRLSFSRDTVTEDPTEIAKTIVSLAQRHNNTTKR